MKVSLVGQVHLWRVNQAIFLVSVPKHLSDDIKELSEGLTNGFGSLKVEATIGTTVWRTSIFPDSKSGLFDLPLKVAVRKANGLEVGSNCAVELQILGF